MKRLERDTSSMWASCCGLLNEVMGTGTVRAQQPGFGAGAGPFRFAPSAGYSTYPPTSSGSAGQLCKACGLAFSVFRRKHICCDCKKSFCALCSVLQENLRCCTTCHLLRGTAFQRPRLMQLRVKDLRQYLLLRNIPTDTCREKEDLVDLVLCHQGASLHSLPNSRAASPPSATRSTSEQSVLSASQGDVLSPSDSSGTTSQEHEDTPAASLLNLEPTESLIEVSPATQRRIRASLSDLDNEEAIENLSVRQLKEILARNFVNYSGCCEKWELLERVHRLYRENEQNRKSLENVNITADPVKARLAADENLCRICMDDELLCMTSHRAQCCSRREQLLGLCNQTVASGLPRFAPLPSLLTYVPVPLLSGGPASAAPGHSLFLSLVYKTHSRNPCHHVVLASVCFDSTHRRGEDTRWSCGYLKWTGLLL
uniref:RING-type E3 ubiquitin transferase n=1 Tax=Amphilophus citrinellus TaxID=61819 RepID=A0A3Q0SIE9_AMPCI